MVTTTNCLRSVLCVIAGTRPLLMHNGDLADKLNPWVRKMKLITNKPAKKRTDADEEELARLEWNGGLWYDEVNERPCVLATAIEGCIRNGAKAARQGTDAVAGVSAVEESYPLIYDGPKDREKLWTKEQNGRRQFVDRRGVGIQKARIMRTRPRFDKWSLEFELLVDTEAIQLDDVHRALIESGARRGLGDFRPRFGLFTVDKFEVVVIEKAA
jgi:hypothetical protein